MSDELKVYPLMLHESTMKKLEAAAVAKNTKVEPIIEGWVDLLSDPVIVLSLQRLGVNIT